MAYVDPNMTQEKVIKLLTSGDLAPGGAMAEEEQKEFVLLIREYSVMLAGAIPLGDARRPDSPLARMGERGTPGNITLKVHSTGAISGHYDQLYVPVPITVPVVESTVVPSTVAARQTQYGGTPVRFGRRRFDCGKLRSSYSLSTEFWAQSIRNGALEQELQQALGPRIATDYEDLAINGDVALAEVAEDPRRVLLRGNDGWLKQSLDQSIQMDGGAQYVSWDLFLQMAMSIPDERIVRMPDIKWWVHPHLMFDWVRLLATRSGSEGAAAMSGSPIQPFGLPFVQIPLLPRSRDITVSTATPARAIGYGAGPFQFPTTGDSLVFAVDQALDTNLVTLTFEDIESTTVQDRTQQVQRTCNLINAALLADANHGAAYSNVARPSEHGVIELVSPTTGAASSVQVAAASTASATLGLTEERVTGSAAAAGNTMPEGTVIWFGPASNFVWHIVTGLPGEASGIRMFSQFRQSEDSIITDVYAYVDATIQDPGALVVADNVRVSRTHQLPA